MNDYFSSLVNRHLGTSDTIQPRVPGRFEVDRSRGTLDSPDEVINSVISGVNAATVTSHESDLMGSKKDDPSSSFPELNEHSTQLDLSEQQEVPPDFHALPTRPVETHPSEKKDWLLNAAVSLDSAPTSEAQTNHQNAEHGPENEMDHRIHAMLQRLLGGSGSPVTQPALDEQNSQQDERQISVPSEEKPPLLNAAAATLDSVLNSERQTNRQNNVSADGEGKNTALYESLEPPSWLAEIENRFNTQLKDIEAKTEPVINVTIGRVEVRAVQAEVPKKTRHAKKPTGVMPLDEYLKKREDRGM